MGIVAVDMRRLALFELLIMNLESLNLGFIKGFL